MPDPLQYEFNKFNQSEEKQHRSVQFSGLYCIGSPESIYWRVKFGHQEYAVKVGKSVDCLRRFNEYRLYYPHSNPDMKIHLILMMPHAVTKEQKSNVDRAETFVLSELKRLYPNTSHWPGIDNQFRLHFSRSEWVQGVNMQVITKLFAKARDSGDYGPCLLVENNGKINVPALWYKFKAKVVTDVQAKRLQKKADDEKDEKLVEKRNLHTRKWDSVYAPKLYEHAAKRFRPLRAASFSLGAPPVDDDDQGLRGLAS